MPESRQATAAVAPRAPNVAWGAGPVALLAGAAAAAVYAATLAPDLTAGDAGELATAAARLAPAHPPGYPVWVATAHAAVRLLAPLGVAPVLATNLLSAAAAAAAAGLAAGALLRLTGNRTAAVAAAVALAATGPVWAAAVVTEVYAQALLGAVALGALLLATPPRAAGRGRLFAAGLLASLALLAHQANLLLVVVSAPWLLAAARPWRRARWVACGAAVGLLPLALLAARATACPDLRWGWQGPPDLLRWLLRTVYDSGRGEPAAELAAWPARAWLLLCALGRDVSVVGLALAGAGWWLEARRPGGRRAAAGAAAALVVLTIAALPLLAPFAPDPAGAAGVAPFLYLTTPALAVGWASVFAAGLRAAALRRRRLAAALACLAFPAVLVWAGWPYHDRGRDVVARLYAEDLLRAVPTGGTLVVEGDNETFPLLYLRVVEGRRPDVAVRHRRGCVFAGGPDLYRLPPARRDAAAALADAALLAAAGGGNGAPLCWASGTTVPPGAAARLAPRGLVARLGAPATGGSVRGDDPEPGLAQSALAAPVAFLDPPTRRILQAYAAVEARRAAAAGDAAGRALALRAFARLEGRDPGPAPQTPLAPAPARP